MKILIIGSYGFLGTNLLNKLGSNVNYEIYVLIKKTSKSRQKNLNHHRVFYYEDLEGDKSLFNNKFDAIIDCSVCYGRKEKSSEVYITNFINPLKIIEYSINNTGLYIGFDSYYSKKEFQNMEYL
ncbi:NAD-dependent epimerase/dehydratase family protein, partial [Flavobacteriaceae bacterium]|nr:NAD-dependent epimerase/dehydratase family protein [Flavobacteriaceae bacterium]